jgi:hypothetical protein
MADMGTAALQNISQIL